MTRFLYIAVGCTMLGGGPLASGVAHAQEPPPAADTVGVEQIVAAGWEAARADRHAEAADLFRRAIALDPVWRRELLPELAVRLTHSGRAAEAVPLYHEVLSWELSPEEERRARRGLALSLTRNRQLEDATEHYAALVAADPEDVEARLGYAQASASLGRLGAARSAYEAVLARDPANREARLGLAQISSRQGRHREAQRRLLQYLREHPEDVDARFMLAQTQTWLGRHDRAAPSLYALLTEHPAHRPAQSLVREIASRQQRDTRVDLHHISQSDGLQVTTLSILQEVPLNQGLTRVDVRLHRSEWEPRPRSGDPDAVTRLGVALRHRLSDWAELGGSGHINAIERRAREDRREASYEARATFWPDDLFRFGLVASRTTFEDLNALTPGITMTYAGGSLDFTPNPLTRASLRANWGRISDGNQRQWVQGEVERRVRTRPVVLLGVNYTTFGFAEEARPQYFSPERYSAGTGSVRAWHVLRDRIYVGGDGMYGIENTAGGRSRALWGAGLRGSYRVAPRWEVEGRTQIFDSRRFFATPDRGGNYRRYLVGGGLRYTW